MADTKLSAEAAAATLSGMYLRGIDATPADKRFGEALFAEAMSGHLFGMTLSNNGSDATNDIDIAPGVTVDSTRSAFLKLSSVLTKQLDAGWSVGSAAGGLDQGSIANATYHVHAIIRPDTAVVDAIYSLSHDRRMTATMTIASPGVVTAGVAGAGHGLVAGSPIKFETTGALPTGVTAGTQYYVIATGLTETAFQFSTSNGGSAVNTTGSQSGVHTLVPGPKLPTNYTLFRRIGSIVRASAAIKGFTQVGDEFRWNTPILDINTSAQSTSAILYTLTVPIGIKVSPFLDVSINASSGHSVLFTSPDQTDTAAAINGLGYTISASTYGDAAPRLMTNNSGQVRARGTTASTNIFGTVHGFIDTRGRLG